MVFGIERKHVIIILLIMSFVFSLCGSTLAYFNWQTSEEQRTEVVFTIEEHFTCSADGGGNITAQDAKLRPTTCMDSEHAIKRTIKVKPTIYGDTSILMDLWLDVNVLDSGLSNSQNFRYALTTSDNSCTEGVVEMGNFNGKSVGDKIPLLNYINYSETATETYYLYIWLDAVETSTETMNQNFDLSLNGSCTNAPEPQTYVVYSETDNSLRIYKRYEEEVSPMNNTFNNSNVFMPKYTDSLYNVDNMASDDMVYVDLENSFYHYIENTPWYEYREEIKSIIIEDEISPKSMNNWFNGMTNVEYIDVSKVNTSRMTSMSSLFHSVGYNVESFEIIGLDNWNTSSVTSMNDMFNGAGQNATTWSIGDLSRWDVSNVTSMNYMFYGAGQNATTWSIGDLSRWNVSNVTNMSKMFDGTGTNVNNFIIIGLDNWNTSKVTNMSYMFYGAGQNATTWSIGDLSRWDVSNVTNMGSMFAYSGQKATTWDIGDIGNWNTSKVVYMNHMFWFTGQPAILWNIGDISRWDVSNVTNMQNMFSIAGQNATTFNIGDLSKWNTLNVTNMANMFYNAGGKASNWSLDLSGWNVNLVTNYANFNANVESKVTPPVWIN